METATELEQLQPDGPWYVFESIGEFQSQGPRQSQNKVGIGVKGYVKRNGFDSNYFQVLARTEKGHIAGFYLKASTAAYLLWLIKPAPATARPDAHWTGYWQTWK